MLVPEIRSSRLVWIRGCHQVLLHVGSEAAVDFLPKRCLLIVADQATNTRLLYHMANEKKGPENMTYDDLHMA